MIRTDRRSCWPVEKKERANRSVRGGEERSEGSDTVGPEGQRGGKDWVVTGDKL